MNIEDVKEELKSYKDDSKMIDDIEKEVEFYDAKLLSCTSQLSATPKGGPVVQDKIAEYIAKLEDLKVEKYTRLIELETKKELIEHTISKIKQPYKRLLYLAYIKEWENVDKNGVIRQEIGYGLPVTASIMGYEYKYFCRELHKTALFEYMKVRDGNVSYETSKNR